MNKNWTIYDTATGKIKRTGFCPPQMIEIQVKEGESVLVGYTGDPKTQKVEGGQLVDK